MAEAFTVTQVNNYIKNLMSRDFALNRITVKGEVSNCKYHSSGHVYFTLKDSGGALNCIMFAGQRQSLTFKMTDGQKVEASGQISVYEKTGSYQLYVRKCTLAGEGELYEKYLKLKNELQEMGMFDELYKKSIPNYCKSIGVATALTGAAVRDIINVSKRRNPYVDIVVCPTQVQGQGAAESIVRSIKRLDGMGLDVIIVGRGGGSIEDLWAFNEEIVARAIFEAETPIISAVGHETDFTIADFVADLRAPTPSAAAELASFEYEAFAEQLSAEKLQLKRAVDYKLNILRSSLMRRSERLRRLSPEAVMENHRLRLGDIRLRLSKGALLKLEQNRLRQSAFAEGIERAMSTKLSGTKQELQVYAARMDGLSPLKKMSAGYGYFTDKNGHSISRIDDVHTGDEVSVYISNGKVNSRVISLERLSYE
ncbi:MAG: exodeoxyribonuclease VII large subunit [Eubacteriales bacterium]|nr:exodeoxyribonuclease VII large subunit [Eubacteriales bacterium]